ncbi:MAG: hypothetical protein MJY92_07135, partial [Bacteroidales bacterium]|nr:hypothetical protein [Bacteroidales bacterium]
MFRKKNIFLIAALLLCLPVAAAAQDNAAETGNAPAAGNSRHIKRFDVKADRKVFIPKGNIMFGGFVGYNSLQGENLNFLILKDISMRGYNLNAAPYIGGFVADNFAIGARFRYTRYMAGLDNLDLSLGSDLNIKLQDLYAISHTYEGDLFGRYYMPFGNSKMFGMFAEFRLTYKRSQGKNTTGTGKELDGTYQMGHTAGFYINPGLCI